LRRLVEGLSAASRAIHSKSKPNGETGPASVTIAQDCRLTASESLPGGGTRARSARWFVGLPVCAQLAVGVFSLFGELVLASAISLSELDDHRVIVRSAIANAVSVS
jgi:hypothetical protein